MNSPSTPSRRVVGEKLSASPDGPTPALLTTAQAAKWFGVHPKTILRLRRRHGLPCVTIGGALRFPLAQVTRWLNLRREGQ
jgi:excisionase family DNA binding protein